MMPNLITTGNTLTMTSREIAELTGKRHDNVMRVCRDLKATGVTPQIEESQFQHLGNTYTEFKLGKRDSLVLVARLSPEFTAAVVDRWIELEEEVSTPAIPQSLPEALRLAADLAEQNQVLAIENKQQAGKIACMENLFKPGMTVTQFCKGLNGVNVMLVSSALESRHWLFNESKSSTRWRVGSYARDRYMTEEQIEITPHGSEPFIQYKPVLLKKGAARLYELYLSEELPMKKAWDGRFTHDKALQGAA